MQRVSFDWEIWSCCCLNFHWLSFQELPLKVEKGCPSPSHSFWIFLCWFEGSLWSFEIFLGGYLRQARNHCKSVPESAKLTYVYKTRVYPSQKFGNSVLNKATSTIPSLSNDLEVLPYAFDKAKLFAEIFSKNSNLDHSGISLSAFPSRTNLKLHNVHATHNLVNKVIINFDSSKVSCPYCIPMVVLE